jgi:CheY-like chemotaxis protein
MGQVAAGVAHEINNPLTYVIGALDEAAGALRRGEADGVPGLLAEARGGAERVRRIVGDLRVFARQGGEAEGTCDASAVARVAVAMLQNEIRHRARLEQALPPAAPAAIPEHRLVQVLVNLLMNACHAIGEGHAGENRISLAVITGDGRVVVEVRDTGAGMDAAVRARIFEPFFTTRKVGEGMGLGLALCQAMVAEAGGSIEVESAPGEGSVFRVVLRAAGEAAATSTPTPTPTPTSTPTSTSTPTPTSTSTPALRILVVDDEPMVGRAVARLLGGHAVELATSGAQALARVRAGPAYQAIVCDLMMPDMTGMELHERLSGEAPDAARRMIFLTGGAFTERARAFVERDGVRVLEKPVEPDQLREAVAAAAAP